MPVEPKLVVDLIHKHWDKKHLLPPQMTRLVKLIYLSELEYYRRTQKRLTDLDWKFYHYGPYPPALMSVLGNPDVERLEWKGGKTSKQIMRPRDLDEFFEHPSAEHDIETSVSQVVKQWGDADLNTLLDYVYFETEPMQNAQRGEYLDFSLVKKPAKKIELRLDQSKLNELRHRVSKRAGDYLAMREAALVPEKLFENLHLWDESNARFPQGDCDIRVEDLTPKE